MKKAKIISAIAAAILAISSAAILTGCGGGSSSKTSSSSSAADTTAAPTTTGSAYGGENGDFTETPNDDPQATGEELSQETQEDVDYTIDDDIAEDEKHGDITSSQAAQTALQNCGYGMDVTLVEPADYNDEDCWHVVVKDTEGKYINCYVGSAMFVSIPQDDPQDPYADVEGYYDFGGGGGADRAEP